MAKPLIFDYSGVQLPFSLSKVDRAELYGYIDLEAQDEQGRRCTLATLAEDGQTVVASGGTAFGWMSPDGNWLRKETLKHVDLEGHEIKPVPSSFSAPVQLAKTATIEEYLSHNIKSVYQLTCEADAGPLLAELKKGAIYTFPYSYRGGLEADVGFLLLNAEGTLFLAVGTPTKIEFVGLQQAGAVVEEEAPDAEEEEAIDFGMM